MNNIPKIKKKIKTFLTKEDGKITKESIIKTGIVCSLASLATLKNVKAGHSNEDTHSNALESCNEKFYNKNSEDVKLPESQKVSVTKIIKEGTNEIKAGHENCSGHSSHSSHNNAWDCCFPAGTLISTPQKDKKIEDVTIGDTVLSYNTKKEEIEEAKVLELESPKREGIYLLNEDLVKVTNEHPFYMKKGEEIGWGSIETEATLKYHPQFKEKLMKLEEGDQVFHKELGWITIDNIKYIEQEIQTYNLKTVDKNNNFFANKLLVHNKGGSVICSELFRQGYLSKKEIECDNQYGREKVLPEVYLGYRIIADPIVKLMQKNKFFTILVYPFVKAWTKHMMYQLQEREKDSFFGRQINKLGSKICIWTYNTKNRNIQLNLSKC